MEDARLQKYKEVLGKVLDSGTYSKEIQKYFLDNIHLKELSVYINNLCNLRCKHCSFGFPSGNQYLHSEELSADELVNFIDKNFSNQENSIIAFAGREPFFNDKIIGVLEKLNKLVENGSKFRYGVVSNGTLIKKYFPFLKENKNLNWIDISLDGDEKTHDFIRGQGVYQKAIESLGELLNNKIVRYSGISTCCHKGNYSILPELFEKLYKEINLTNICLLPYVYTGTNNKKFLSSKKEFVEFYKKLMNHEKLSELPINILWDFEWFTIPFVQELYKKNLFSIDDLKLDKEKTPYILLKKGKMNICLKFTMLEFDRFLLSSDGYFGTMFILEDPNYWKFSVCNIRDCKITDGVLRKTLEIQFEHINRNLEQHKDVLLSEVLSSSDLKEKK